ncbi:hypothetical protein GQ457_17G013440 [Hibiscus cannabinus]
MKSNGGCKAHVAVYNISRNEYHSKVGSKDPTKGNRRVEDHFVEIERPSRKSNSTSWKMRRRRYHSCSCISDSVAVPAAETKKSNNSPQFRGIMMLISRNQFDNGVEDDEILNHRFSALISSPSALYLEDLGCRFFLELKSIVLLSRAGKIFSCGYFSES